MANQASSAAQSAFTRHMMGINIHHLTEKSAIFLSG